MVILYNTELTTLSGTKDKGVTKFERRKDTCLNLERR